MCPLALIAGFVDAIAGGGGLISLPAYFFAGLPPHAAIATNKLSSTLGTLVATVRYALFGYMVKRFVVAGVACGLVGSAIGVKGAILPLVFGTVPFYTRQVEVALAGVNEGKVEAARSMGSGTLGLIFRVYLHEAVPELIRVTTVTAISLIGLTTMAGAVGAGGIGSFAINYGQNQNHQDIVNVCVVVLLIVVFILQSLGNALARRTTNRGLFRKVHK